MVLNDWGTIFDIVQVAVTGLAIVIGGLWTYNKFIKKRESYPRASFKHKIIEINLNDDMRLIHLCIEIKNISDVLLSLVSYDVRICQIIPLDVKLSQAISKGENPIAKNQEEILWPNLYERKKEWKAGRHELEPQEEDIFHFDFIIDKNVSTIQTYSYFKNSSKAEREIGWNCTTFHNLN